LSDIKSPPRGTETILVVDDDDGIRSMTRHMLKALGYTILQASSGVEALRVAGQHTSPIHLLISDVVMAGMTGRQIALELTRQRGAIKVLFLSAYSADAVLYDGIVKDKVNFLQKPFSPLVLALKIREVLDSPGADLSAD
jgi:CheY-like chemotaxis protein